MAKKKRNFQKQPSLTATVWAAQADAAQREYRAPVDALFAFGETDWNQPWPDYSALSLGESDAGELSRMASDHRLDFSLSPLVGSAPIHAMRVLARRGNPDFLPALFQSLIPREDYDFFREELTPVIVTLGETAIEVVQQFLALPETSPHDRACLAAGLVELARKQRETHARVVDVLTGQLARFAENSEEWNGFLISYLIDLAAGETLPLIERAFAAERVDEFICGDLQEVRAEFGLAPPRRDTGPLFLLDTRAKLPHPSRGLPPQPKKP